MTLALIVLALLGAASGAWADCISLPSTGLCKAHQPRYFYSATSGKCEYFVYGGCGGNSNNYNTLSECEHACVELTLEDCSAEPEVGFCRAAIPAFYFDRWTGTCKTFLYGGCGGNKNNFGAERHCMDKCGRFATLIDPVPAVECTAEPEVGMCRALIPSFFWNHRTGSCQEFGYGGCDGNSNRFETSESCQEACQGTPVTLADCSAKPVTGMCMAYFPSYFHNITSGKCEEFIYGGCGGNSNRFQTHQSCHSTCIDAVSVPIPPVFDERLAVGACAMPKVIGPCRARIPRFYYDAATQSCQEFGYGGCQGNDNNFQTVEECHNTCIA